MESHMSVHPIQGPCVDLAALQEHMQLAPVDGLQVQHIQAAVVRSMWVTMQSQGMSVRSLYLPSAGEAEGLAADQCVSFLLQTVEGEWGGGGGGGGRLDMYDCVMEESGSFMWGMS